MRDRHSQLSLIGFSLIEGSGKKCVVNRSGNTKKSPGGRDDSPEPKPCRATNATLVIVEPGDSAAVVDLARPVLRTPPAVAEHSIGYGPQTTEAKVDESQALAAWQRIYDTPGEAVDALIAWNKSLGRGERPEGYAVSEVPGMPLKYMLHPIVPVGTILEVFCDTIDQFDTLRLCIRPHLKSCVDETMIERRLVP